MREALESGIFAGGAEEGMEMVQAAFSIAIAACLGLIVTTVATGWIVPEIRELPAPFAEVFETLALTGIATTEPGGA